VSTAASPSDLQEDDPPSKNYHAHDEDDQFKPGDIVWIEESKPISKLKRWTVVRGEHKKSPEAKSACGWPEIAGPASRLQAQILARQIKRTRCINDFRCRPNLDVADNSGRTPCHVYQGAWGLQAPLCHRGRHHVVSIKEAIPRGKVKKGDVMKAVVVRVRKDIRPSRRFGDPFRPQRRRLDQQPVGARHPHLRAGAARAARQEPHEDHLAGAGGFVMAAKIRKGDKVIVLSGRDKGRTGEVFEVHPAAEQGAGSRINMVRRHQKQTGAQEGGIISKESSIHLSNLAYVGKGRQTDARRIQDSRGRQEVRIAKSSGAEIDWLRPLMCRACARNTTRLFAAS